jgi:hypothetical protein
MAAMLKCDCDQLPRWLARRQPRDLVRTYHKCCVKIVRHFAEHGGLIAYGIDLIDLYRRPAGYIDRILQGAKPSELPSWSSI